MNFSLKNTTIAFICLFSFYSFGQEMGKTTIKVGTSLPNGLLGNLVKSGKGVALQFNSDYVYQVRSRFSIEYYTYAPNDSAFSTYSSVGGVHPYDLFFEKFNSLDVSFGLDYNPFQQLIPELYFGPELYLGSDRTSFTVNDPTNLDIYSDSRRFIHGGFKVHVGYEKTIGKLTLFTEYNFGKAIAENYNIHYYPRNFVSTNYHQLGLGIRF
jgi:hypothetical protein